VFVVAVEIRIRTVGKRSLGEQLGIAFGSLALMA
jgi:hypothetical protein